MKMKKRKQLVLSLLNKKHEPENNEKTIDFRGSDVQEDEKDIT